MKRCRISGKGGNPGEHDGNDALDGEDEDEDEDAPSAWAVDQASAQPRLLPGLRFHDLVFGQVLGEGSFGTVKVHTCTSHAHQHT
jgi:hypothetical protein